MHPINTPNQPTLSTPLSIHPLTFHLTPHLPHPLSLIPLLSLHLHMTVPKPTSGTHKFIRTYNLIDPSQSDPRFPMVLNIFANTLEEFPVNICTGVITIACPNVLPQKYILMSQHAIAYLISVTLVISVTPPPPLPIFIHC